MPGLCELIRHSGESRKRSSPKVIQGRKRSFVWPWTPAFTGVTEKLEFSNDPDAAFRRDDRAKAANGARL
jgi:hypothetical protein